MTVYLIIHLKQCVTSSDLKHKAKQGKKLSDVRKHLNLTVPAAQSLIGAYPKLVVLQP